MLKEIHEGQEHWSALAGGKRVSEHGAYRPVCTPLVTSRNSAGIWTRVTIMTEWLLAQKLTYPGALESGMNKGGRSEVPDSLGFLTEDLAEVPWASEQPEGAEAQRTRLHGIPDRTRNTHGKESLAWCVGLQLILNTYSVM